MILGRGDGPVGSWWFETDVPGETVSPAALRDLLGLCRTAAMTPHAIVTRNRLLNRVDVDGDVVPTYQPQSSTGAC